MNERVNSRSGSPSIPAGTRLYAIGDIHGRCDLLDELLALVKADVQARVPERTIYVFLGDYVDRGCCSRQTIDRLVLHAAEHECVFLKGNHESMALKCLTDPTHIEQWLRLGGAETLASYGISPELMSGSRHVVALQSAFHNALPAAHLRFFRGLQNFFSYGDYYFVHAGVKPSVELDRQVESDLLWIRDEFLSSTKDFGKIIVHGHTPTIEIEMRPNRINIDTGAFGTGRLSCLAIEDDTLTTLQTAPRQGV